MQKKIKKVERGRKERRKGERGGKERESVNILKICGREIPFFSSRASKSVGSHPDWKLLRTLSGLSARIRENTCSSLYIAV